MSIRVCSEDAVHGLCMEGSLKIITLNTRGKAVDGTGAELCPIVVFHIGSSKSSSFTIRVLVIIHECISVGKYLKT
jgi:hypothetical protein